MTLQTITKLNQLNQDFYQKVAPHFDDSRQYHWTGWEKLIPTIAKLITHTPLRVVDIGAGNGRFLEFLREKFPTQPIQYLAVDSNEYLLEQDWQKSVSNIERSQLKIDIIDTLLSKSFLNTLSDHFWGNEVDLIVSFGFLHHIPSTELRQQFVGDLISLSANGHRPSVIAVSAWQFATDEQQQKKMVEPALAGIDPSELEPNDYILSWNRGVTAYRYCHFLNSEEITNLPTTSNLQLTTFYGDGKSNELNRYLVWYKSEA